MKDLTSFMKASPIAEAETPRERETEVSIKQLKERTHRLLEKTTKVLQTAESLTSCTHARAKGEYAGEDLERNHDLDSGMPTLRVEREVQDGLKAILKEKGKSFADWVKEQLEIEEAKETIYKKAYNEGYEDGYDEAKKKHLVTFPCSICGKPIEITHPKTKEAVAKYMREYGWGSFCASSFSSSRTPSPSSSN